MVGSLFYLSPLFGISIILPFPHHQIYYFIKFRLLFPRYCFSSLRMMGQGQNHRFIVCLFFARQEKAPSSLHSSAGSACPALTLTHITIMNPVVSPNSVHYLQSTVSVQTLPSHMVILRNQSNDPSH